jgi:hypothetical protein
MGMSCSQLLLTPSFFRGVAGEKPPTSWKMMEEIFNERENDPLPSGNLLHSYGK